MKNLDKTNKVSPFDMYKLEVEYDYDTDREQIVNSKTML